MSTLTYSFGKFVFTVPTGLLYSRQDVWAREEGTNVRIGLTDFAQRTGGDVVFVELATPGAELRAGGDAGSYETIKVNLPIPSPLDGEVVEVNARLEARPELLNEEPYGEGWVAVVKPRGDWRRGLLDASQYMEVMKVKVEQELARR